MFSFAADKPEAEHTNDYLAFTVDCDLKLF